MHGGVVREMEPAQLSFPPFATPLAHTRSVAVQAPGSEIVEVILKPPLGVHPEIAQERPGIDAGGMHIVEPDPDGIIADRINGENGDVTLAANRFAFRLGMTLQFGGGAGDAEQLRRKTERPAIVERDMQCAAVLRKPNFNRPRRGNTGFAQGRDLFISFVARPMPTAFYPFGPIRLFPGSPTRAPLVVNATALGS